MSPLSLQIRSIRIFRKEKFGRTNFDAGLTNPRLEVFFKICSRDINMALRGTRLNVSQIRRITLTWCCIVGHIPHLFFLLLMVWNITILNCDIIYSSIGFNERLSSSDLWMHNTRPFGCGHSGRLCGLMAIQVRRGTCHIVPFVLFELPNRKKSSHYC